MQYHHLSRDAHAIGLVCPPAQLLKDEIAQLGSGIHRAVVKIILTRGDSVRGYAIPSPSSLTRIVTLSAFPQYPADNYQDGVDLHLCELRLGVQPRLAGIKHLNRLENVLARMEWHDSRYADGLLLDMDGYVIECTASNIFIRNGNVLTTPDLSRCGVAGVTRQRILDQAPALGYETEVVRFDLTALMSADEVVICNSLFGVWQVRRLASQNWPEGHLARQLRLMLGMQDETSI